MFKPHDFEIAKKCVWHHKTKTGFDQRVMIMYHSTPSSENAASILANGFLPSRPENNMLGRGIYVSASIKKCIKYGLITFKLLVYPGLVLPIHYQGHPQQKTWQNNYSCAWVPPNCGMVRSGMEVRIKNNLQKHAVWGLQLYRIQNFHSTLVLGKLHTITGPNNGPGNCAGMGIPPLRSPPSH